MGTKETKKTRAVVREQLIFCVKGCSSVVKLFC